MLPRKRNTIACVLLVVAALLFVGLLNFSTSGKRYTDLVVPDSEYASIISTRQKSDISPVNGILFNETPLVYASQDNCYYYSASLDEYTARNPVVSLETTAPSIYNIRFDRTYISQEIMASNTQIAFAVYNDDSYWESTLILTSLPVMSVDTESPEITREEAAGSMVLVDGTATGKDMTTQSEIGINVRGNMQAYFEQRGYKLTLYEYSLGGNIRKWDKSLLGMQQGSEWVLYSGYTDAEKIRNVFSSNLWYASSNKNNSLDTETGNEYKYIELICNGNYQGLYALGYKLEKSRLNIVEGEHIYQNMGYGSIPAIETINDCTPLNNWAIDGVLEKQSSGWAPLNNLLLFQEISTKRATLSGEQLELINTVGTGFIQTTAIESIDVDNAIDSYLFACLIQTVDGIQKNVRLVSRTSYGNNTVLLFLPWDADQTWGDHFSSSEANLMANYYYPYYGNTLLSINPIHSLILLNADEIIQQVKTRYKELRNTHWSNESIASMIAEYEIQVFNSGAFQRDADRWQNANRNTDTKEQLSKFKEYVLLRLQVMDEFVDSLPKSLNGDYSTSVEPNEWTLSKVIENLDTRVFTEEELEGFSKSNLRILRNAFYALHGYSFFDKSLQTYFEDFDWYVAQYPPLMNVITFPNLNDYEKENFMLICELEHTK